MLQSPPALAAYPTRCDRQAPRALTLWQLFQSCRWSLLLMYGLFNVENVLRLVQPLAVGLAINDFLDSRWRGLWLFLGQHLGYLVISWWRRVYDTRVFTRLATRLSRSWCWTSAAGPSR